jgi:hemerythrin-like domain-containing protein
MIAIIGGPRPQGLLSRLVQLIQELRAEHDLIEAVAASLRAFVRLRLRGEGDPADGPGFVRFLRLYAGHFHHAREEDTLFSALTGRAALPASGPIEALVGDHHRLAKLLDEIDALLQRDASAPGLHALAERTAEARRLERGAVEYSRALWSHIDAENSVLFPEAEARLRKAGVCELPSRALTADEEEARGMGEALVGRYPPLHDAVAMRGDGCVCCPAMGERCRGLELEWWNEWEWEEFEDHIAEG